MWRILVLMICFLVSFVLSISIVLTNKFNLVAALRITLEWKDQSCWDLLAMTQIAHRRRGVATKLHRFRTREIGKGESKSVFHSIVNW